MTNSTERLARLGLRTFTAFILFGTVTSLSCVLIGMVIAVAAPHIAFESTNFIAGILGIFVNFWLNYAFNFGGRSAARNSVAEFGRFFLVGLASVVLAWALSYLVRMAFTQTVCCKTLLETSLLVRSIAYGGVLIAVAILSYVGHALYSFGTR